MDRSFASLLIEWQRASGRHDLPWQHTDDPYRVWLSEIMLQQTQVATVIPYYLRFVADLGDVMALAAADADHVMALWSGLGYYSRARNLHRCARIVVREYGGKFPSDPAALESLPGIGRSTAAAIAVFAFGARAAILDGNVRRVFARVFAVEGDPASASVQRTLWSIAERELPGDELRAYTQGLMDLGATICTRSKPDCARCPLASRCEAYRQSRVADLPTPRRRRVLPVREAAMLIARRADSVLLVRRPPSGIWGGLWSLPEQPLDMPCAESVEAAALEMAARAGLGLESGRPLDVLEHAFTHFRLRVHPYLARVGDQGAYRAADADRWVATADLGAAPLPGPVRRLLEACFGSQDLMAAQEIADHDHPGHRGVGDHQ